MSFGGAGGDAAALCPSVVRLRGLPWSVSHEEVSNFLDGCSVVAVHFTFVRDGRPSGEAYVDLATEEDVTQALSKNQQHMGKRYIEVFRAKRDEMEYVVQRSGEGSKRSEGPGGEGGDEDAVVRLRGLPFHCTKEDIIKFFDGLVILQNGISQLTDELGRQSGEAYVQFAQSEHAEQALLKHKERMGHRYVEIFRSNLEEACNAITNQGYGSGKMNRSTPYDRPGMGGRGSGMRGMRGGGLGGLGFGAGRIGNIKGIMDYNSGYGSSFGDGYEEQYDDDYTSDFSRGTYGGLTRGSMGFGKPGLFRGSSGGLRGLQRGATGRGMSSSYGGGASGRGGRGGASRGGGGGGGGRGGKLSVYQSLTGHSIHMRGLPYTSTTSDIYAFFSPILPTNVVLVNNEEGRPSGEGDVDFSSHSEAELAMKKNKATLGAEYGTNYSSFATQGY